jgi:IMP dehydrogenase/GMP reductase
MRTKDGTKPHEKVKPIKNTRPMGRMRRKTKRENEKEKRKEIGRRVSQNKKESRKSNNIIETGGRREISGEESGREG